MSEYYDDDDCMYSDEQEFLEAAAKHDPASTAWPRLSLDLGPVAWALIDPPVNSRPCWECKLLANGFRYYSPQFETYREAKLWTLHEAARLVGKSHEEHEDSLMAIRRLLQENEYA